MSTPIQIDILAEIKDFRKDFESHKADSRDRLMRIETLTSDLPRRVSALERIKWQLLGGASVVSAACAFIFRHIL
jgi:hypothetical protein